MNLPRAPLIRPMRAHFSRCWKRGFHRMLDRIMLMPKVVIAAINGDCMGGGYELALACDFRLAADGAYQIGLPEAVLGILPGGGGTQRLPRLIGRGRALEVMLFGNVYHPRDAERMGMVNRVLAPETLMSFAMGWARTLAKRPPRSIAAIKRAVYLGADRDLEAGLYIERTEMRDVMCTEDARTIMNAYNAGRAQRSDGGAQRLPERNRCARGQGKIGPGRHD